VSEEFELDWLDLREPHDAMARSEALAEALIARLPARPRLMDLGAGTGSLFRWLAPRIGRAQAWTLVDQNKEMTEAAFDTIADRAETVGLKVTFPNRRTLLVHAPGGAWRVEALIADLAHAPGNLPVGNVDAVVCSALCDLVSAGWVERMAAAIRVPFYACLNVDGRDRFLPPVPGDALATGALYLPPPFHATTLFIPRAALLPRRGCAPRRCARAAQGATHRGAAWRPR
jgi:SAM-dependent methyltransferase